MNNCMRGNIFENEFILGVKPINEVNPFLVMGGGKPAVEITLKNSFLQNYD